MVAPVSPDSEFLRYISWEMRSFFLSVLLIYSAALNAISSSGQNSGKEKAPIYKLQTVRFVGSSRYTPDQLLAASGLRVGAETPSTSFQEAATRLSQSGAFTEVKYRFNGAEAQYDVTDNPNLVPCTFENLVWISDQDLLSALQNRVPLFTGQVPLNGDLAANVGKGIETILKEKGVTASISVLPASSLNGPIKSVSFSATTPRVEIAEIEFTGASPNQLPALKEATASLVGTDYLQTMLQDFATNRLRPIYLNQGYLHVEFAKAIAVPLSTSADSARVKITVPIQEGPIYRLAKLNWPGSDILPATAAAKLYLLKPGDVLNQDLLKKSLSNLGSAYLRQGYLKPNIKGTPTFDEAVHSVAYDIEVAPGELYHLRKVEFKNISESQLQKVQDVWKLKPGDVYDPTYAPSFLVKNRDSLRVLDGWSAVWTQTIDDDKKVVDLVMTFRPGGALK